MEAYREAPEPGPGTRYPVALASSPGGRQIYVLGANFDRRYRGGALAVADTTTDKWLGSSRVEVPGYASDLLVEPRLGAGPESALLWVAAREDDSLTRIEATSAGGGAPVLACGQAAGGPCAAAWRLGGGKDGKEEVGDDPVAVRSSGGLLHLGAAADGRVSLLRFDQGGLEKLTHLVFGSGVTDIAISPLTGRAYVADALANRLHSYEIVPGAAAPTMRLRTAITLPGVSAGEFGRGLALSTDGGRLYVAWRNPNALLVVDVAPTAGGAPRDQLVDLIGLGDKPARVVVAPTAEGGGDLIYASCYGSDEVWVVDPGLRTVIGVIALDHAPYAMAAAKVPGAGWKLYVALFGRHEVVAIPLEPGQAGRHTVTAHLKWGQGGP
jgi:DNA-binding beta-propeller fold protein YncE